MLKITFISEKYRKNDSQLSLGGGGVRAQDTSQDITNSKNKF